MFALALMIGLLSGACSSIFISSFIWLALQPHGQPHSPAELHGRRLFAGLALAIVLGSSAVWLALPRLLPSASSNIVRAANLGDLSACALIAQHSLQLEQQGALPDAKARIKNLETAWEQAEEQLQPRKRRTN
jgi:hypothetical protein